MSDTEATFTPPPHAPDPVVVDAETPARAGRVLLKAEQWRAAIDKVDALRAKFLQSEQRVAGFVGSHVDTLSLNLQLAGMRTALAVAEQSKIQAEAALLAELTREAGQ